MAELTVIWWRDIPAQVVASAGRHEKAKAELPERFQEAIDAAAMRAGLIGTDSYLEEWRRETRECGDDLEAEAAVEATRLDETYTNDDLERLVRTYGRENGE